MTKVWRVLCEWDLGQDYVLFTDYYKAYDWVIKRLSEVSIEESIDELMEEGLVTIEEVNVL